MPCFWCVSLAATRLIVVLERRRPQLINTFAARINGNRNVRKFHGNIRRSQATCHTQLNSWHCWDCANIRIRLKVFFTLYLIDLTGFPWFCVIKIRSRPEYFVREISIPFTITFLSISREIFRVVVNI